MPIALALQQPGIGDGLAGVDGQRLAGHGGVDGAGWRRCSASGCRRSRWCRSAVVLLAFSSVFGRLGACRCRQFDCRHQGDNPSPVSCRLVLSTSSADVPSTRTPSAPVPVLSIANISCTSNSPSPVASRSPALDDGLTGGETMVPVASMVPAASLFSARSPDIADGAEANDGVVDVLQRVRLGKPRQCRECCCRHPAMTKPAALEL